MLYPQPGRLRLVVGRLAHPKTLSPQTIMKAMSSQQDQPRRPGELPHELPSGMPTRARTTLEHTDGRKRFVVSCVGPSH
jgi:hypothetical protein